MLIASGVKLKGDAIICNLSLIWKLAMGLILMYSTPLRFKVGKQNLHDILRLFLKLVRSRYCIYIP